MVRRFEGWNCPGDAALLLASRRGSGQVQGSEGPVGTSGRVAMGAEEGQGHWAHPLGAPVTGANPE